MVCGLKITPSFSFAWTPPDPLGKMGGDTGEGIFLGAKKRSSGGEGAWRRRKEKGKKE